MGLTTIFMQFIYFDSEKNHNTKSGTRAVEVVNYAVCSGMSMQFESERPCSLAGICTQMDKLNYKRII